MGEEDALWAYLNAQREAIELALDLVDPGGDWRVALLVRAGAGHTEGTYAVSRRVDEGFEDILATVEEARATASEAAAREEVN